MRGAILLRRFAARGAVAPGSQRRKGQTIDRRTFLGAVTATAAAPVSATPAPAPPSAKPASETIPLWPDVPPGSPEELPQPDLKKAGAPGKKTYKLRGVAMPALFVYRPDKPNGVGLIVVPGGGYAFVSIEQEGSDVARLFVAEGYTVFVLGYRLPAEGWTNRADAPIQDGLRAMRLVRKRAAGYGVDPARIGMLGFSAGGHLAASVATGYADALYDPIDSADALPARPAFVGLFYAVTTMHALETHSVSRANLLGPDPTTALVERRSPLSHIGKDTPPSFVVHALDDRTVDPACSIDWLTAARAAGVPVEAHILERGGHGFGVGLPHDNPGSRWPELFRLWAAKHGG